MIAAVGCPHCGGRHYEVLINPHGIRWQVMCLGCNARGPSANHKHDAFCAWVERYVEPPAVVSKASPIKR